MTDSRDRQLAGGWGSEKTGRKQGQTVRVNVVEVGGLVHVVKS